LADSLPARALAVWLMIAVTESIHGILRELLMAPMLGDALARRIAFFVACALIVFIAWLTAPWLEATSRRQQLWVGALWMALMFAFEVGLGRAQDMGWDRILAEYDVRRGGLMAFGMLLLLLAPMIGAGLRRRAGRQA